jgi:hypothetical protein
MHFSKRFASKGPQGDHQYQNNEYRNSSESGAQPHKRPRTISTAVKSKCPDKRSFKEKWIQAAPSCGPLFLSGKIPISKKWDYFSVVIRIQIIPEAAITIPLPDDDWNMTSSLARALLDRVDILQDKTMGCQEGKFILLQMCAYLGTRAAEYGVVVSGWEPCPFPFPPRKRFLLLHTQVQDLQAKGDGRPVLSANKWQTFGTRITAKIRLSRRTANPFRNLKAACCSASKFL